MKFSKITFLLSFVLLAFTSGDTKSEYILPLRASSICTTDLNLDGNNDIVVGHKYSSQSAWGGLSILLNEGQGFLQLADSFYFDYGFPFVNVDKFDNNNFPDIFSIHITTNPYTVYAGIVYNYAETQFDSIKSFVINYDEMVDHITSGDVNGDGYKDIVIACNTDKFWRVLYNDGAGNFNGSPYYITDLFPNDLAVGDIDGNGRDDIAIAGSNTEINYSFETGFELFNFSGYEHSIELNDMDKDGDNDVITVLGAGVTSYVIYENLGYQNFQQHIIYTFQNASGGLRLPDLNNDSLPEITFMDGVKYYILYNNGNYEFTAPDTISPINFSGSQTYIWENVDNNNYKDILIIREYNAYVSNLKIMFNDGNGNFVEDPITIVENPNKKIKIPNLYCYPNPFTTETNIKINIEKISFVELSVFDLSGKKVKNLINNTREGGSVIIKWCGLDNGGNPCKPGPYLLSLKVNGNVLQTIKLIKY
jgi:hypothetical protein